MFPRRGSIAPPAKTFRLLRWHGWAFVASLVLVLMCVVGPSSVSSGERPGGSDDGEDGLTSTSASPLPPLQLPKDYEVECGDELWHGSFEALNRDGDSDDNDAAGGGEDEGVATARRRLSSPPVSIAISYCEASIDWLTDAVKELDVRRVTVYSKCGNVPVKGLPEGAEVGGCSKLNPS